MDTESRILGERKDKVAALMKQGINPYPYSFKRNADAAELRKAYSHLTAEQKDPAGKIFRIAGRLMITRIMGKAAFASVMDVTGNIQLYLRQDTLGEESYALFKALDMGDFIGVEGVAFKTKTNELTLEVKHLELLSKSMRPLPEKFHGLKDHELRYRKRYLDLISNPDLKRTFILRARMIREFRRYLNEQEYVEVETPILQAQYGGAAAKPFITRHNALNTDLFLRISPEPYLKRLLVAGFERVYDMNKNFRNEGIDFDHNPEFTMIEWYEAYSDYNRMMDMCEEVIKRAAMNVFGKMSFNFREMEINLEGDWPRMPMAEALKQYADLDVDAMSDDELLELAEQHQYHLPEKSRGHLINFLFEELVEEKLVNPTFIIDHPVEVSPLTKRHRSKDGCVERAELFMAKSEIANIYSELNDPAEQRIRLEEQERQRKQDEEHNYPMDEDFCESLEYGMPPAGGIGIGVDRIFMILSETSSIREVILFPTLRPENK
ncbi:MAG: lysine--tRNA ligase [archaeon]